MDVSLRTVFLAVAVGLTLPLGRGSAETTFLWPEPGAVVTTKPHVGQEKGERRAGQITADSLAFPNINQEANELEEQRSQSRGDNAERQERSPQGVELLPNPVEGYQLPTDDPETVLLAPSNSILQDEILPPQSQTTTRDFVPQSEPVQEYQEGSAKFTVSDSQESALDDPFSPRNINAWRPLNFAGQLVAGGLFVGGETTFLTASRENYQSVAIDSLVSSASLAGENSSGYGAGGRGWIGMRSGKTGFVATAWHFHEGNSNSPGTMFGKDSASPATIYNLQATTVDLELFQEFCIMNSSLRVSFGGRYADYRRRGYATGFGSMEDADVFAGSHGATSMSGWGLTGSLAGYHPLRRPLTEHHDFGHCVSPWSFQWLLRGSVIDGEAIASARTEAQVSHPLGVSRSVDGTIAGWEGIMSSGMLQFGIGYRRPLVYLPAMLDFVTGFEGHIQQTGRVGAASTSYATLAGHDGASDFGAVSVADSLVNTRDLVLTGFFMRWSLNY